MIKQFVFPCILLIVVIAGCTETAQKENSNPSKTPVVSEKSDSTKLVSIVNDFFKAFDEKDTGNISHLLIPDTKVIHYNGVVTNTAAMIKIIDETKDWYPRTRKISEYEYFSGGSIAVLGCLNEVTFTLPQKKVEERYRETWVFQRIENDWKPVRIHYSKIITDKHSEEVK